MLDEWWQLMSINIEKRWQTAWLCAPMRNPCKGQGPNRESYRKETMPFEKAKLAFCLEDKIKQNGFPLGEEEITRLEKKYFH